MIGQALGKFVIKTELGRGGMGTVYLAHDPSTGRDVAIKVPHANLARDQTFRNSFQREAQILGRLEHANIVPIFEFGESNNTPFIVMKLMKGGNLQDRLHSNSNFTISEAIKIIERVCTALEKAHANDIIHRDLKPANIFFD
jgi:serine/threonine-protein kinase